MVRSATWGDGSAGSVEDELDEISVEARRVWQFPGEVMRVLTEDRGCWHIGSTGIRKVTGPG